MFCSLINSLLPAFKNIFGPNPSLPPLAIISFTHFQLQFSFALKSIFNITCYFKTARSKMEQQQAGSSSSNPTTLPTPSTDRSPSRDDIGGSQHSRRVEPTNPLASPSVSRPASSESSGVITRRPAAPRYFHSRRIKKGEEVEKPWLKKRDHREKWVTILPITGFLVGLGISAFLVWDGLRSVAKHNYCLVLEDNFANFNDNVWTKEVQVGGFG